MGAEYQANPGSSRIEYLDSAAYYFSEDIEKFSDLSDDDKAACRKAFEEGVREERGLQ